MRLALLGLGWLSLVIGLIGIFLPLLPTTPFVLFSAGIFAKCHPGLREKLLAHRQFGPIILNWEQRRAIPPRAKRQASLAIFLVFPLSIWAVDPLGLKMMLVGIALVCLLFIWTRPD
ncbi:MAG: YbaN family protein [Acidobacteria bacterium]|nr:YbaN family protein [Acidobacteriota bacterium]MCB9399286.1 YbaN family protein [Acidobacteriota bacterium]